MILRELFEPNLVELKMNPATLRSLASKIPATCGIEFEMVLSDRIAPVSSVSMYKKIKSFDEIENFFGDYTSHRDLSRVLNDLENTFQGWARDKAQDIPIDHDWLLDWVKRNVSSEEVESELKADGIDDASYDNFLEWISARGFDSGYYRNAWDEFVEEQMQEYTQQEFLEAFRLETLEDVYRQFPNRLEKPSLDFDAAYAEVADDIGYLLKRGVDWSSQYHGASRGNHYIVEPDSSIRVNNEERDLPVELVSPPLSVEQMMSDYRKIHSWLFNAGYTNRSTGLHINISIPGYREDQVDYLKLVLLSGDEHVLEQFDRLASSYAANALELIRDEIESKKDPTKTVAELKLNLDEFAKKVTNRYIGRGHLSIVIKMNRIEVRSPGGDWLKLDPEVIENVINRYIVALDAAMDPAKYREDYLKKLYQVLDPEIQPVYQQIFRFYAGAISKDEFKRLMQTKYKTGLLKPSAPVTEAEIVTELFDQPLPHSPLEWDGANRASWFYIDGLTYVFLAKDYGSHRYWTIQFYMVDAQPDSETKDKYPWSIKAWRQIKPRLEDTGSIRMTNTGNSFKVMSTIVDIFIMFLSEENPEEISFSAKAKDRGRVKLYRRLANQAAKEFNYSVTEKDSSSEITWYLIKPTEENNDN